MKRWGLIWLCLVVVLPWLSPPVLAATMEEVSGYWNATFRSKIEMSAKLSSGREFFSRDSETGTGYLWLDPGGTAFEFHTDNWKTDEILSGSFGLFKKGKAILFTPDPDANAGLEKALGAWLQELAARKRIVVSDMRFAFDAPSVTQGKVSGKTNPAIKFNFSLKGLIFATFNGVEGKCRFNFHSTVVCPAKFVPGSRAVVSLPPRIPPSSVAIQCAMGTYSLNPDGTFTLAGASSVPFLVVASVAGTPIAFSIFEPGKPSNSLSCKETAVTLVMLKSALFAIPPSVFSQALELIRGIPEVNLLGLVLCEELSQRPDAMVVPSPRLIDALTNACVAVNAALESLLAQP